APGPIHPRGLFEPGSNHAAALAVPLGLPVARLRGRSRHTPSQIDLPREQRRANVSGAFAISPDPRSPIPDPRIVVLVDDVSTTGATLSECAVALKQSGVKEVRALTAARVGR
ncbi:MAG: ComF family protein, partial [Acidimicrobiia bacterium]